MQFSWTKSKEKGKDNTITTPLSRNKNEVTTPSLQLFVTLIAN